MCFGEYLAIIYKSILAQMTFATGYPILWLSLKGGESNMMYKGPKDIESLMFFLNDKLGNGRQEKKVRFIT